MMRRRGCRTAHMSTDAGLRPPAWTLVRHSPRLLRVIRACRCPQKGSAGSALKVKPCENVLGGAARDCTTATRQSMWPNARTHGTLHARWGCGCPSMPCTESHPAGQAQREATQRNTHAFPARSQGPGRSTYKTPAPPRHSARQEKRRRIRRDTRPRTAPRRAP